jgi:leader peptidase (prepilin peptidase) / N-methyltransferase
VTDPILLVLAFIIGASIGSFLNVCIARWPLEQSVISPRSRCPNCGHAITAVENIPVVSWLILRGRCSGCALPISFQYPLVELLTGLAWVACVAAYGPSLTALRIAIFATVMFGIAVTDLKHYLIPDGFTVFGLVFLLATAMLAAFRGETTPFAGPYDALLGACVGAGAISIAGWLGEAALKKEAMGFGDVTLMAVVGAAVGPGRALLVVFVGALLGAVTFLLVVYPIARLRRARRPASAATVGVDGVPSDMPPEAGGVPDDASHARDVELPQVPFGVFLAPAAVVTLLWGQPLIEWYLAYMATA